MSPVVDCIVWGCIIGVSGVVALIKLIRVLRADRLDVPQIPERFRFPLAYLITLADLSALVLLLGMFGVLDRWGSAHMPFWGYIGLMGFLYLLYSYFLARIWPTPIRTGLAWGCVLAVLFGAMGLFLLREANAQDLYWQAQTTGIFEPAYTDELMDTPIGAVLGRLNLPACVLMDSYSYARYENLSGVHTFSRETLTLWVCLCPAILFTIGWLAGQLTAKRGNDHA